MIQKNSYQSETLQEYSKELPKQLELTHKNTTYPMSGIKKGTKDMRKSIGQEELCNGSSMDLLTMEANSKPNCIHPLPTKSSTVIALELRDKFRDIPLYKIPEAIAQEETINCYATRIEIRDNANISPQTRLQAADSIDKPLRPDRIEINQQKQEFSVINYIDQLVIKQTIINQAISKPDIDKVIDITPTDNNDKDIK